MSEAVDVTTALTESEETFLFALRSLEVPAQKMGDGYCRLYEVLCEKEKEAIYLVHWFHRSGLGWQ